MPETYTKFKDPIQSKTCKFFEENGCDAWIDLIPELAAEALQAYPTPQYMKSDDDLAHRWQYYPIKIDALDWVIKLNDIVMENKINAWHPEDLFIIETIIDTLKYLSGCQKNMESLMRTMGFLSPTHQQLSSLIEWMLSDSRREVFVKTHKIEQISDAEGDIDRIRLIALWSIEEQLQLAQVYEKKMVFARILASLFSEARKRA